jgi:hypothetical protein
MLVEWSNTIRETAIFQCLPSRKQLGPVEAGPIHDHHKRTAGDRPFQDFAGFNSYTGLKPALFRMEVGQGMPRLRRTKQDGDSIELADGWH